jgi:GH35 family endo-1,4-beta-xylanase
MLDICKKHIGNMEIKMTINEYERTFNDNWKYKSYDLKNMIKKLLKSNKDTM